MKGNKIMYKDSFNLFILLFAIIGCLIALKILLRIYLYLVYKKIIVPLVNKTDSDNNSVYDIVNKYFEYLKIDNITFKNSEKRLALFKNFNQKTKEFTINNLHTNLLNTNLCQLNLDYILSCCWLTEKMINNKCEYSWIKFTYYFLPIINTIIFWLTLILLVVFNITYYYNSETFKNNTIVIYLYKTNIFLSVLIASACFSILYIFIENFIKLKLENEYEKAIKPFIIENYSQYYHDWLASRMYCRSIIFANFYLKAILRGKNQEYKYLGCFVKV